MDLVKVVANSRSTSVAEAIAGIIRERGRVDVQAIGAGAVNQAVKAIAIARGYLELDNIEIACIPSFAEVLIDGMVRNAQPCVWRSNRASLCPPTLGRRYLRHI